MAINWTEIEGYREDMTAEEKLQLLENVKLPAQNDPPAPAPAPARNMVSKAQFDQVSSELAAVKKALKGKMSEDEQRELDRQAERDAMETELKALRREKTLAGHKASFLAQGYDDALAEEAATAMADGDTDTVFTAMKKHQAAMEKAMRAQILKETPVPPAGDDPNDENKKREEMKKLRSYFGLPT